jgi:hypothetical protein
VIALDDGSVVVTNGFAAWRFRDGRMRAVLPASRDTHWISWLVPLEGGAFAFVDVAHDRVVRVEQDGSRRVLASLALDGALNAGLAARGDELVVVQGGAEGLRSRDVLLHFRGRAWPARYAPVATRACTAAAMGSALPVSSVRGSSARGWVAMGPCYCSRDARCAAWFRPAARARGSRCVHRRGASSPAG